MKNWIDELKIGLLITKIKGDLRQPQNYAMERVPARFSRWQTASQYFYEIERILKELKVSISFVRELPNQDFFTLHSINAEDYIMYHQGYFLDLVHQLKDKICLLVHAIITPKNDYSWKDEKKVELGKLIKDIRVIKIPDLITSLNEWNEAINSTSVIVRVLKKRTVYHHFKNTLSGDENYMQAKTHSFMLTPSFQNQLSDYGKQMIAERGKESLLSWQKDTLKKMSDTLSVIEANLQNVARCLVRYFHFPKNDHSGGVLLQQFLKLDDLVHVKKSMYTKTQLNPHFQAILESLDQGFRSILGDKLVSFYVIGSLPRNEFRFGFSDLNSVLIIKNDAIEIKQVVAKTLDEYAHSLGIPTETQAFTEEEFQNITSQKIRFICATDGLLVSGLDLCTSGWKQPTCFKLAWILNQDFKEHIIKAKELLCDPQRKFTENELELLTRDLAKRAFRLSFSQVIGNNTRYSSSFKAMFELSNFYYPKNKPFNQKMYQLITKRISIQKESILALIETLEKQLYPLYEAINNIVNPKVEI